jgi:phenylacetate-CoA ligase
LSTDPLPKIQALIRALVPANRFVSGRLMATKIANGLESIEDFTKSVPCTQKDDLAADQEANPPYGTNLTFSIDRYTRFCQTSGTTSRPLSILDTAESWRWMLDNWQHIFEAAEVSSGSKVYFAFSFGPFLGFWTAFEAAVERGCLCFPGGGLTSAARLRAIAEHRVEVVCCTPTYALRLAEVAREEGIGASLDSVRTLIVAGEPGGSLPAVRMRIRAGWKNARVFDHYGMTEVGPVAFEDPEKEGSLRIVEDSYFAEVIQPGGNEPVPEGDVGELVLTPLGRAAWPLLRYRTGDLVRCSCDSRGLLLHGGILGRADDMVVIRGVNIYPSAVEALIRQVPEIAEYQVQIETGAELLEMTIHVETSEAASAKRLERLLNETFSLRIPVELTPSGTLPRFEMKARRWVRLSS